MKKILLLGCVALGLSACGARGEVAKDAALRICDSVPTARAIIARAQRENDLPRVNALLTALETHCPTIRMFIDTAPGAEVPPALQPSNPIP